MSVYSFTYLLTYSTRAVSRMAVAMHHIHLVTLPSLPSHSGRQVHWATLVAGLSTAHINTMPWLPKGYRYRYYIRMYPLYWPTGSCIFITAWGQSYMFLQWTATSVSALLMVQMIVALPDNVHRLMQQDCCWDSCCSGGLPPVKQHICRIVCRHSQ